MLSEVFVVGLTGQSGTGKTTVSKVFESNGFELINADLISREVMKRDSDCLKEVAETFEDILLEDGTLNRKKLAESIFSNNNKLEILNTITYPYITKEILNRINELSENNVNLVLLDAPTLFESRADDFCELIISVLSDEKSRVKRIMNRDSITEELANKRLKSQLNDQYLIEHSDFIIKNNNTIEDLEAKAKEVSDKIKEYYYAKKNQ